MQWIGRPGPIARHGVSLLEILVAVGIISVLAALIVPGVRAARWRALDMQNASNLRTTHQHFRDWGVSHDDVFVNRGPPAPGQRFVYELGPGNGFLVGPYAMQDRLWPLVLAPWMGEGSEAWHSVYAPPPEEPHEIVKTLGVPHAVRSTSFVYGATMLYDPRLYDPDAPAPESWASARRRVRWSETVHAASKGLLYDEARVGVRGGHSHHVAFVDGSVSLVDFRGFQGQNAGKRFAPVTATPRGIHGIDFVRR